MNLSVVHYDSDHIPNPNPKGETPFEDFWESGHLSLPLHKSMAKLGLNPIRTIHAIG